MIFLIIIRKYNSSYEGCFYDYHVFYRKNFIDRLMKRKLQEPVDIEYTTEYCMLIEEIEKNVKLEIVSLTNTFKSQISKIENKIKELESKLRLQSIIRPEDERIASLLAKINQLEGKIMMIERKISSKAPIVLE